MKLIATRRFSDDELCRYFDLPLETKSLEIVEDAVFTEVKFATTGGGEGTFSGYGAMFGNIDSHGDMILPGAFAESLAERKAQGRGVPMHLMHRIFGGDGLPVGVWTNVEEDDKGLKVEGKISGMNTDAGRRIFELVKDGALGGLSIGYKVKPNGAAYGKKPGEPKRTLKNLHLGEVSLVDDPSNAMTRVNEIKSIIRDEIKAATTFTPDVDKAAEHVGEAIRKHDKSMGGGDSYSYATGKDRAIVMDHMRSAHEALTGRKTPDGVEGWAKSAPSTIREFETLLRESGFSNTKARAIAESGFKAFSPRDEDDEAKAVAEAAADLKKYFEGL